MELGHDSHAIIQVPDCFKIGYDIGISMCVCVLNELPFWMLLSAYLLCLSALVYLLRLSVLFYQLPDSEKCRTSKFHCLVP
jgi:hypothetical protein